MGLFTKRDRIAIAGIAVLILIGWGIRLAQHRAASEDDLRVIRHAIPVPPVLESPDSLAALLHVIIKPVNISTASPSELEGLPLIGPVKAAAIVSYREQHGPFRDIDDLTKVRGIGPATLARIRKHIVLGDGAEEPGTER